MHSISRAVIRNFRSCAEVEVDLADFTPLVGYNNAGKSNIIRALEWAIEPKVQAEADFYDIDKPVEVECVVKGVDESVLERLGTHRSRIEPHIESESIRIRTIQGTPGGSTRDVKREIWMPSEDTWGNPQGIPNAIKALFPDVIRIEAMVDINSELSSNKTSTTIGKLIKAIMAPIVKEQGTKIQEALEELNALFGVEGDKRSEALSKFDMLASEAINDFFPGFKARLHAPAPQLKEIFKGGKLVFSEESGGKEVWREVQYYGHGVLRAAQMAMVRMLAKNDSVDEAGKVFLLIDEPELYMHPQMIESLRMALRKLSRGGYQVVFSTHSPILIGRDEVPDAVMVNKPDRATQVRKTLRACCDEVAGCATQVESLTLDLNNSSQFLFCDKVVFCEGATERELFPDLIDILVGESLLKSGAALVALNGCAGLPKSRRVLEAMGISQKAIVDLDFAFTNGKHLHVWDEKDTLYRDCLRSMRRLAGERGYSLNGNGLFKNGEKASSEEAYHVFATSDEGVGLVGQVFDLFKYNRVWVWPLGSIEYHLGMSEKGGQAIRSYRESLLVGDPDRVVTDKKGVLDALRWSLDLK